MSNHHILKKPIITEKSTSKQSGSKFVFQVDKTANKHQIKQAVEDVYKVTVTKINTLIVPGKTRRVGKTRKQIKTPSWKKAIVYLQPKDKIDLFDIKEK